MIAEERIVHECPSLTKEIRVAYYYEVIKDGESVVVAKGIDGMFYRLVAKSPTGAGQPGRPTINGTICSAQLSTLNISEGRRGLMQRISTVGSSPGCFSLDNMTVALLVLV